MCSQIDSSLQKENFIYVLRHPNFQHKAKQCRLNANWPDKPNQMQNNFVIWWRSMVHSPQQHRWHPLFRFFRYDDISHPTSLSVEKRIFLIYFDTFPFTDETFYIWWQLANEYCRIGVKITRYPQRLKDAQRVDEFSSPFCTLKLFPMFLVRLSQLACFPSAARWASQDVGKTFHIFISFRGIPMPNSKSFPPSISKNFHWKGTEVREREKSKWWQFFLCCCWLQSSNPNHIHVQRWFILVMIFWKWKKYISWNESFSPPTPARLFIRLYLKVSKAWGEDEKLRNLILERENESVTS